VKNSLKRVDIMEKNITEIVNQNPNSIEINKTTRGYTYSVKGYGNDFKEILKRLHEIIQELEQNFQSDSV
jgi:hypothetical protein